MERESLYQDLEMSELCCTIQKDGGLLKVEIYADGERGWTLEISNSKGSMCWTDPFETEQDALEEALAVIEEEGIEYFQNHPPAPPVREH